MFKKIINYTGIFQHSLVKYTKHILCLLNIIPISAGSGTGKAKAKLRAQEC